MTAGVRALSEARQLEILTAPTLTASMPTMIPTASTTSVRSSSARIGCSGRWITTTRRSQITRPIQRTRRPPSAFSRSCWPRSTDLRAVRAVRGQPTRLAQVCLADRLFFDQAALDERSGDECRGSVDAPYSLEVVPACWGRASAGACPSSLLVPASGPSRLTRARRCLSNGLVLRFLRSHS